jgi:hypothetical protein
MLWAAHYVPDRVVEVSELTELHSDVVLVVLAGQWQVSEAGSHSAHTWRGDASVGKPSSCHRRPVEPHRVGVGVRRVQRRRSAIGQPTQSCNGVLVFPSSRKGQAVCVAQRVLYNRCTCGSCCGQRGSCCGQHGSACKRNLCRHDDFGCWWQCYEREHQPPTLSKSVRSPPRKSTWHCAGPQFSGSNFSTCRRRPVVCPVMGLLTRTLLPRCRDLYRSGVGGAARTDVDAVVSLLVAR